MSEMVEIDIDFDYCGEVEMILAHDECGEHDDVEFYRNDLLAAENAKLRELVRTMMRFFEDDDWCTTCWCAKECDAQEQYEDDCLMRDVFHNLMRELGIEGDE